MANSYLELFEEEFYPSAFRVLAKEVTRQFDEKQEKITLDIKNYLKGYLDDLCRLQEVKLAGSVAQITLSLLYTSFEEELVEFRIDSYGEGGFLYEDTLLTERFPAPWLAGQMGVLEKELEKRTVEEKLRRYIRPAEWERLKLRALRSLLVYFTSRFRYVIMDALDQKRLAKVKKEETFMISMGEYLDWQKVIFALRPEVDIFNCEAHTTFCFRRFSAVYYEGKNFRKLDIQQARFTDCTFQDCRIEGCQMHDSIFDGCTFKNVIISRTEMMGCLFIDCSFQECEFRKADFFAEGTAADRNTDREIYYESAEFLACAITECRIENSDLRKVHVKDCDIQGLDIGNSVVAGSGFLEDDRITWLEKSQE